MCWILLLLKRAANLVVPNLGVEATSDVTSSGLVKLEDLQRILSNLGPAGNKFHWEMLFYALTTVLRPNLFFLLRCLQIVLLILMEVIIWYSFPGFLFRQEISLQLHAIIFKVQTIRLYRMYTVHPVLKCIFHNDDE